MVTKSHNSNVNLQKWACNNPNLDVVKVNAYEIFLSNSINLFAKYWAETEFWW